MRRLANVEILEALCYGASGSRPGRRSGYYCLGEQQDDGANSGTSAGVATIGAGNLEHRTSIKTGDEIEDLADRI